MWQLFGAAKSQIVGAKRSTLDVLGVLHPPLLTYTEYLVFPLYKTFQKKISRSKCIILSHPNSSNINTAFIEVVFRWRSEVNFTGLRFILVWKCYANTCENFCIKLILQMRKNKNFRGIIKILNCKILVPNNFFPWNAFPNVKKFQHLLRVRGGRGSTIKLETC